MILDRSIESNIGLGLIKKSAWFGERNYCDETQKRFYFFSIQNFGWDISCANFLERYSHVPVRIKHCNFLIWPLNSRFAKHDISITNIRNFIEIFTRGSQTVILVPELSRFSNNILWSEIFRIIFADQNKNFVTVNKLPDPFRCSLASAFRSNHPVRITSITIDDKRQFHRFVRVKFYCVCFLFRLFKTF